MCQAETLQIDSTYTTMKASFGWHIHDTIYSTMSYDTLTFQSNLHH